MTETQPRSMEMLYVRETKRQKRTERYNEMSKREEDKVTNGCTEEKRERERDSEEEGEREEGGNAETKNDTARCVRQRCAAAPFDVSVCVALEAG